MTTRSLVIGRPDWPDNYRNESNNGTDVITGSSENNKITGGNGEDTLKGGDGHDELYGDSQSDALFGDNGDDKLFGGSEGDKLNGGDGDDQLTGSGGRDELNGEIGKDTFFYYSLNDSRGNAPDKIFSFEPGNDFIDLEGVDANLTNNQANGPADFFTLVTSFNNNPGQLVIDAVTNRVLGDVDGNATADFIIEFSGNLPLLGDFGW